MTSLCGWVRMFVACGVKNTYEIAHVCSWKKNYHYATHITKPIGRVVVVTEGGYTPAVNACCGRAVLSTLLQCSTNVCLSTQIYKYSLILHISLYTNAVFQRCIAKAQLLYLSYLMWYLQPNKIIDCFKEVPLSFLQPFSFTDLTSEGRVCTCSPIYLGKGNLLR